MFANVNQGLLGDPLYQPGPLDGGGITDYFASLHRFVPIQLGGVAANRVDAAVGRPVPVTDAPEPRQPASLDEAERIVEREFLGTVGIHAVGKKLSKNAVRVYASSESMALTSAVHHMKTRCAPFEVDVVIEGKPLAAPPPSDVKPQPTKDPEPQ